MPSYFKPLRRKIGLITLVMACGGMIGWASSFQFRYSLTLRYQTTRTDEIVSTDGALCWVTSHSKNPDLQFYWPDWSVDPYMSVRQTFEPIANERDFFGFRSFDVVRAGSRPSRTWAAPYWSVVIPLTLLSAWLLLSKPHAKNAGLFEPSGN